MAPIFATIFTPHIGNRVLLMPVDNLWITFYRLTLNDPRVKVRVRVKNGQNSAKVDPP